MALFRGTVTGGRGTASRLGHSTTGLEVVAQSWNGQIRTRLYTCPTHGWDAVELTLERHGGGDSVLIYRGPLSAMRPYFDGTDDEIAAERAERLGEAA